MPKSKHHRENKPTYRKKSDAIRHGYIQYGKKGRGRNFVVYKVKGGFNVRRK